MVEENLHLSVLKKAFEEVKSSKDTITVNNYTIHRGLLLLFSPFISDLLASIPESNPAIITIPDTNLFDLVNVSELLLHGTCTNVKSTSDARDLFITLRTLGIEVQRLERRSDGSEEEAVINVASEDAADINQHQAKKVVFTYDLPNDEEASTEQIQNSTEQQTASLSSPLPPPQPIQIKKEVAEPPNTQDQALCDPQQDSEPSAPMETEAVTPQEPNEKETEMKQATEKTGDELKLETHKCQKCQKHFPTLIMLKSHYCGHFLSIIKKKFQSSYSDLNCLEKNCNKKFPSLQKLLVHIGVIHDKINIILKMKGIEELPPNQMPTENSKPTKDVKSEPHIKPTSKPATPTIKQKQGVTPEQAVATPKPANTVPILAPPVPLQTPARKTPEVDSPTSVYQTPTEKKSLDKECNFTQECQVCKQKMASLHLLEQHLCRHFMKEIADTYSHLQDDLKCTLCASVFKQKHSLILHIGCKHGKINEVLKSKNFPVLPAPVLNNPTSAMQKQLQRVKKERMESESETPVKQTNVNVVSEPTPVSQLLAAQTLLQPPSTSSGSSVQTLDEILKKYKMNISTSK